QERTHRRAKDEISQHLADIDDHLAAQWISNEGGGLDAKHISSRPTQRARQRPADGWEQAPLGKRVCKSQTEAKEAAKERHDGQSTKDLTEGLAHKLCEGPANRDAHRCGGSARHHPPEAKRPMRRSCVSLHMCRSLCCAPTWSHLPSDRVGGVPPSRH